MSLDELLAEKAIRDTVIRYGLCADAGDTAGALACHTENAVYVVRNPDAGREGRDGGDLILRGKKDIGAMLCSERHRSLVAQGCAHTVGPLIVTVLGDTATVEGYSRVYLQEASGPRLFRVAANFWTMQRDGKAWLIARRESRGMGD